MTQAFRAFQHANYRRHFIVTLVAMAADSIEHVISYWVIAERFHSPVLGGIAVVSHWVPFLLFSFFAGSLADRRDCRRLIQLAQGLFLSASLAWALLFWTGRLEAWHTVVILTVHGMAGVFADPANQLVVFDMVGPGDLPSAIRLNASSRQAAFLLGPAIGGLLLLWLGPVGGLLVNAALYLPLIAWMAVMPYTGHHLHGAEVVREPPGFRTQLRIMREVATDRRVFLLFIVAGVAAFFVGNGMQPQMPTFARHFGAGGDQTRYTLMLAANGAGAIMGGVALELGWGPRPTVRSTILSTLLWGLTLVLFVLSASYPAALVLLVLAGFLNITYASMAQTLVQLMAPAKLRGRVVGLFNMAQMGLRAGSGVTIGVFGTVVGVFWSLGVSAAVVVATMATLLVVFRGAIGRETSLK